jgi:capsular exopolysaccharide synthesis family protein
MRRPRIHRVFGLDQHPGLSAFLCNEVKLESVLRQTETPNLWVICAGVPPPNPAELVSSEKMELLLRQTSNLFDHVLIDTPPLLGITDTVILSRLVDGVMLVVHGGKTTRELVRRARQELVNVGAKVFGVVLNNVNLKREGYDHYYYRYHSEYKLTDDSRSIGR